MKIQQKEETNFLALSWTGTGVKRQTLTKGRHRLTGSVWSFPTWVTWDTQNDGTNRNDQPEQTRWLTEVISCLEKGTNTPINPPPQKKKRIIKFDQYDDLHWIFLFIHWPHLVKRYVPPVQSMFTFYHELKTSFQAVAFSHSSSY